MATNFKNSAGTDLESLYDLGNGGQTTYFKNASNTDLGAVFLKAASGTAGSACGFKNSAGTDIGTLFCAKNTKKPTYSSSIAQNYKGDIQCSWLSSSGESSSWNYSSLRSFSASSDKAVKWSINSEDLSGSGCSWFLYPSDTKCTDDGLSRSHSFYGYRTEVTITNSATSIAYKYESCRGANIFATWNNQKTTVCTVPRSDK